MVSTFLSKDNSMDRRLDSVCSIYTLINKQRQKANGEARLYIRITVRGESQKIPLPFYWPVSFFDEQNKVILPRMADDPDYLTFLSIIESEKAKYWKVAKKLLLQDLNFAVEDLKAGVFLVDTGQFLVKWMLFKIKEQVIDKKIKETTGSHHKVSANHVLKYLNKDVEIGSIDSKWLTKYGVWLMKSMTYGGAWSRIKDVKTYVRLAQKSGALINPDFENHYLPKPGNDPVWLEKTELQTLFTLYNDTTLTQENFDCLRSFLFACFCGLRISDLKRFHPSWVQNDEIVFTPTKQKITDTRITILRIPLIPVAKEFLNTLNGDNLVTRSDQKFNERLKILAKLAGINKNLTTHVARHTFATQLAILNVPITVIASLLGHKSLASTLIYIHIAEQVRKTEMEKLQNAFGGFSLKLA